MISQRQSDTLAGEPGLGSAPAAVAREALKPLAPSERRLDVVPTLADLSTWTVFRVLTCMADSGP
jgi:hypothetical protein